MALSFALYAQLVTANWLQSKAQDELDTLRGYASERFGFGPDVELSKTLEMFEAAKLIDFAYIKQHGGYTVDEISKLNVFPFVTTEVQQRLRQEKADFFAAAVGTASQYDLMSFWNDNKNKLPQWYKVAMDIFLLQPSSAFIERVFSILRGCLDSRQESALVDTIESAVMLKYNRHREEKNAAVGSG